MQTKEKRISTKQIGDGKAPNKYWVSISSDYYYLNDGALDWISDNKLFKDKGETIKVFTTYKGAREFVDNDLYMGMHYDDIKVNCITIEDRFSGQLYEKTREFDPESAEISEFETEDLKFSIDAMLKLGATFK
jgi:hypothetical protein